MNNDLQKASMLKRISAFTFDMILLVILVMGLALGLSALFGYNDYSAKMDGYYEKYGQMYGIDVNISLEDYEKLSDEELEKYAAATEALNKDKEAMHTYSVMASMTLMIATLSVVLAFVVMEFAIPLWLGNGQTLGKKIFSIGLMRIDGVKITPFMMFVRAILGKCAIETLPLVLVLIMLVLNVPFGFGLIFVGLILLTQVILLIATRNNSTLHDLLACTVAVDISSQRIFQSPEARMEYMKRISAEAAAKAKY